MNWEIFQNITKEIFKIVFSSGLIVWLTKKWHERLINETLTYSKDDLTTKDIHSTFRRIYAMLWLDMTYLLEPDNIEESIRAKSFDEKGYFKKLENDQIKKYKFRFFEKMNSDKNLMATVDINDKKIIVEFNLRKKDIIKLKEIFNENSYKLLTEQST